MRKFHALYLVALSVACSDGSGPSGAPASVQLERTTLELFVGEKKSLRATVLDARGREARSPLLWSSTNPAVAQVDSMGRIMGVTPGRTDIHVQAGTQSAQATVLVKPTLGFVLPLRGVLNQDFFYTNYVDLQRDAGVRDFQCGLKTYDGHSGTDIVLPSFTRMDQGIDVVAAAAGTVSFVQDGMPDRNKSWTPGGGFANHVIIEHREGFRSYYGHMMRNSIRVTAGQQVQAGAVLGKVGSSGTSDMPHLHIEFRLQGVPTEVHSGNCGPTFTHWSAPPPYQDELRLIRSGMTRVSLDLDVAKDPPAQVDTFSANDSRFWFWVHLHNVRANSLSRFHLITPSGQEITIGSFVHPQFFSMSWWWVWYPIQGQLLAGTYRLRYLNDIHVLSERTIVILPGSAAYRIEVEPSLPRSVVDGGGLSRVHQ
ncbi:MAG: M23 family metallopeptidase [Longimicrobiales bacterium]